MTKDTLNMLQRLVTAGISLDDAHSLRRISMTLHRWHELECGDSNDYASWCITRGRQWRGSFDGPAPSEEAKKSGIGFIHDDNGDAYLERHVHSENKARYTRIP